MTVALLASAMGAGACRRGTRDPLLTYLNAELRLSVQYPASWRSEQAAQEGVWYRYFLGPTAGAARKSAVSATLLVGPLSGSVDDYAQTYLTGNTVSASHEERRPGLAGKSYAFATPNGSTRYALLLLKEEAPAAGATPRVFGLYCQGEAASFGQYAHVLNEMAASLTLERAQDWQEFRVPETALALRLPRTWQHLRRTSGKGIHVEQFKSPALGVDKGAQTVHASLTLSTEPAAGGLLTYYKTVKQQLGPNFGVLAHEPWKDGYTDLLRVETPMASSRVRRFYLVRNGIGFSLICEARDDIFARTAAWCDLIAETLRVGDETGAH